MFRTGAKRLLLPMLRSGGTSGGPLNAGPLQRRAMHPVCGPPKYPITGAEHWILGGGFIFTIMIIPTWGLFALPGWVIEHNRPRD